MKKTIIPKEYSHVFNDIQFLLDKAKAQAYKAVDNIRVQTYWQIGERIVREELQHKNRADYGNKLIKRLAGDLGLGKVNLHYMVKFYKVYPIIQTVSEQLSWSHYVYLITIQDPIERRFYEIQSVREGWSVRDLQTRIKLHEYAKAKKSGKVIIKIPPKLPSPEDIFKNTYNFKFLELTPAYNENDLKKALIEKVEKFLQELGSDFFIGRREVPILVGGNYDKIDLELFHAGLMCYVLVEVKTEHFKHSHVSQIYSYLNWYKEHKWKQGQRQPIGLIICKTKDDETVHYALGDLKKDIFVAEYKTKLPSERKIMSKLKSNNSNQKTTH